MSVRLTWTLVGALWARWRGKYERASAPLDGPLPGWRTGLIVGWAGTRGLVTVATALALPEGFPEREMLLFVAFSVTLGTLLIQGLTLRSLVLALNVQDDALVDREVREARSATAAAAIAALQDEGGPEVDALRGEFETERQVAESAEAGDGRPTFPVQELRAKALSARRDLLLAMRNEGVIGDD